MIRRTAGAEIEAQVRVAARIVPKKRTPICDSSNSVASCGPVNPPI